MIKFHTNVERAKLYFCIFIFILSEEEDKYRTESFQASPENNLP